MSDERAKRALARASWTGRVIPLSREGELDGNVGRTTPEERLDMMWQLALDAWASTGEPLPSYSRAETPGRVIRPHG